jgi:acyl-CoA synthetase (AMP-forming)/AMP-acid ligase II
MLVTGGENVYPAEIENVLYGHESVAECAVFGIPDDRLGEVAAAHIVVVPGASVSQEELVSFCAARVPAFKVPHLVKFVAELPRTPVGKIKKSALREPYWKGLKKSI